MTIQLVHTDEAWGSSWLVMVRALVSDILLDGEGFEVKLRLFAEGDQPGELIEDVCIEAVTDDKLLLDVYPPVLINDIYFLEVLG